MSVVKIEVNKARGVGSVIISANEAFIILEIRNQ